MRQHCGCEALAAAASACPNASFSIDSVDCWPGLGRSADNGVTADWSGLHNNGRGNAGCWQVCDPGVSIQDGSLVAEQP